MVRDTIQSQPGVASEYVIGVGVPPDSKTNHHRQAAGAKAVKPNQRPAQAQAERGAALEDCGGICQSPQLPGRPLGRPSRWAGWGEIGKGLRQRYGQPLRQTPAQLAH